MSLQSVVWKDRMTTMCCVLLFTIALNILTFRNECFVFPFKLPCLIHVCVYVCYATHLKWVWMWTWCFHSRIQFLANKKLNDCFSSRYMSAVNIYTHIYIHTSYTLTHSHFENPNHKVDLEKLMELVSLMRNNGKFEGRSSQPCRW